MTATIGPAGLALAALLLIAGCGGSARTGHTALQAHTAMQALSCQQQSARIQNLVTQYYHDWEGGYQLKAITDLQTARAFWGSMHKAHCPASSYAQANRVLSGLGITL